MLIRLANLLPVPPALPGWQFGLGGVKADRREALGLRMFDEFGRELRYAARSFQKTPDFTATALLTLALCFGANLTIFAVIDAVLFARCRFRRPTGL